MKMFLIGFFMTCLSGVFIAFAGGFQWGTPMMGKFAFVMFSIGMLVGFIFCTVSTSLIESDLDDE
ncbi:hypothetical protein SR89_23360 [Klebsiella aerogenes]|uniref:hypothetical protein n=1 Tax=Klebsiella aerogenes TaxID=548 RepID=UPI0005F035FA|nr:hypothetical protein [Klebsiella aerogenes]KJO49465.1 hypothetical protein SR89_23360 [Klebsiella aerogenes]